MLYELAVQTAVRHLAPKTIYQCQPTICGISCQGSYQSAVFLPLKPSTMASYQCVASTMKAAVCQVFI